MGRSQQVVFPFAVVPSLLSTRRAPRDQSARRAAASPDTDEQPDSETCPGTCPCGGDHARADCTACAFCGDADGQPSPWGRACDACAARFDAEDAEDTRADDWRRENWRPW
jgi:hypothetical protein